VPRKPNLAGLALAALTLIAFAPALHGGFIWDDDDYVTANANLRSASGLWNIWFVPRATPQYYPLIHTSFWIEYQLWGLRAGGYHFINIALHATAAVLLWRLLVKLEVPAAWLAAALWAMHPVQAESVAWITERKNVLSALFYFAAALAYITWAEQPWRKYAVVLVLFMAALLSKTVTCSLPAALGLILWWKCGRLTRDQWQTLAGLFVLGLFFGLMTMMLEREHVLAKGPEWAFTPADRVLIAGRAVWFYATKLVLPINLSFIYPRSPIDAMLWWQWAFPLGVVVALLTLFFMRKTWGRGPIIAALIFVGTLVPALGFFNIYPMRYSFVADHFQYHACAAMLVLIAIGLTRWLGNASYVVLAPLLIVTMVRSHTLADAERLWRDTVAKNPDSWMVNLNLGRVLHERGQVEESRKYIERLIIIAPNVPEAQWNYGISLAAQGRLDEAIAHYTRAIQLRGEPLPFAHRSRGLAYLRQNKLDEAGADFRRAIELKPDLAAGYANLATVYAKQGRTNEARSAMQRAIELDPSLMQLPAR
jgi:protein O-mannosyl-transferase